LSPSPSARGGTIEMKINVDIRRFSTGVRRTFLESLGRRAWLEGQNWDKSITVGMTRSMR